MSAGAVPGGRARICVISEGSYPYITGGVSSWLHDLITFIPEYDFAIHSLSPAAGQELKYRFPANVKEHRDVVIALKPGKSRARRGAGAVAGAMLGFLTAEPREALGCFGEFIRRLDERPVGIDDLIADERVWSYITSSNQALNPLYPFADYFWAWKSVFSMMLAAVSARAPAADVYQSLSTGFAGLAGLAAKVRTGAPFLLSEHGLYHKEREMEIRKADFVRGYQRDMWIDAYARFARLCYLGADALTSLFEENRRRQLALGADASRALVTPNGIDLDRFATVVPAPHDGFRVGLVGRVVPIKDVKTFIAAARIIADRVPDARFLCIGPTDEDKPYYEECVKLAASLRLSDRLVFTGPADVRAHYAELDLLMLTSVREAQPLVILEACAAGVPVVSTSVGNVPELLDYDERFLASPRDPGALAAGALYVHDHPDELRQAVAANRRRVETFYDKRILHARYRELYRSLSEGTWRE